MDRVGRQTPPISDAADYSNVELSPDGKRGGRQRPRSGEALARHLRD
jgi:hypothetical protein